MILNNTNWNELIDAKNIPVDIKVEEWILAAGAEGLAHTKLCDLGRKEGFSIRQINDTVTALKNSGRVLKGGMAWIHSDHIPKDPFAGLKNLLYGSGIDIWQASHTSRIKEVLARAGFNALDEGDIVDLFGPR